MTEASLRAGMVRWGASLFGRGLTPGSSGNISVRLEDGYLVTPTNACLGFLEADRIAKLDAGGRHSSGDAPTKELPLHLAFHAARPSARAVVHLHSTYATLLSCLADVDPDDAMPPITPYVVMRVGRVPVVPYTMPGSADVAPLIASKAPQHAAILLGNHGPVDPFAQTLPGDEERSLAYLCTGSACQPPTREGSAVAAFLREAPAPESPY